MKVWPPASLAAIPIAALALAACADRAPFEHGCERGDAAACRELGAMRAEGRGGPVEKRKADAALARGCDLGAADACALGGDVAYSRDDAEARRLQLAACRLGHAEGCVDAGWMLARGEGGAADPAEARALFAKGCAGGEPDGCTFLALELAGAGDPGARAAFARACAAGDRIACGRAAP